MKKRSLLAAATLILLSVSGAAWAEGNFFRVADVKPGMKGIGKTCFRGSVPEEFQAEIMGVMRGASPGGSAVLARLTGGPLEHTGVFEGMSGSPVFIDGKLLGAVAFSFPFAKEAIAGITPIEQMVDAFVEVPSPTTEGPKIILKKSMLWNYLRRPPQEAGLNDSLLTPLMTQLRSAIFSSAGNSLTPIATPLSFGGFAGETLRRFEPQFRSLGLSVLQGSGGMAAQRAKQIPSLDNDPLQPGSGLVIPLVRGDLDISAGGTATYIDGDKLYAFGHPLFNLGFSDLPVYKARVITVFPSLQSSFEILEATDPVGALRQDRGAGILGILGQNARMIPMRVQLATSRGVRKSLNYEIARDRFLMPLIVNLTLFDTIISSERAMGVSTLAVRGTIKIKGEEPVEIDNRFSSDSNSPAFASLSIALPINFLLTSGFKNLDFEAIDVEIKAAEDDRAAMLDSLRVDRTELKSGEALSLTVVCEKVDGQTAEDTYPIRIPPEITPGQVFMLVADGTTIMDMDAREQGEELIPRNLTQLIKFINNIRKNGRLYVRLFRREAGAVVKGEGLPGLPPSILSILRSERNAGSMSPIQTAPLLEYELPVSDYVVSGSKLLTISIKP
jgi:hypothetical protein